MSRPYIISRLALWLAVAPMLVVVATYRFLPPSIAIHWNSTGVADRYAPAWWGAFILPVTAIFVYIASAWLPRISPRGFAMDQFPRAYASIRNAVLLVLLVATVATTLLNMGKEVPLNQILVAGIGVLFITIGNVMGKITKNFFVGIRTPWTLADDEVWLRTHRFGGAVFVEAGVLLFIISLYDGVIVFVPAVAIVAGLLPVAYSFLIYRRLVGFTGKPPPTAP
jgi:uncharacterized membrane protein